MMVQGKRPNHSAIRHTPGSVTNCSAGEFQLFMSMLNHTSIPKSVSGQAQLLEIASTVADLERPFNAADAEAVHKFVQCANTASEYFSTQVSSFHGEEDIY